MPQCHVDGKIRLTKSEKAWCNKVITILNIVLANDAELTAIQERDIEGCKALLASLQLRYAAPAKKADTKTRPLPFPDDEETAESPPEGWDKIEADSPAA